MKIAIDPELCLKNRFVKAKCTVCIDICPTQSINKNLEIDDNRCINCGLCLSGCPVEAIGGISYSKGAIQQLLSKDESIRLICQKFQENSLWPCLGFLDSILLLTFVSSSANSNKEVAVYLEECETCNRDAAQHIQKMVEEANRLLASDKKIMKSKQKFSALVSKTFSRRQLLSQLLGSSISIAREIVIVDSDKRQPIPRRELFIAYDGIKLILSRIDDNQFTFKKIVINKFCNACGICAKMCGTGALSAVILENVLEIRHNPVLCKNCGICVVQCPQQAILLLPANSLSEDIAGQINMPICTSCKNLYQPIGNTNKCIDCVQEQHKQFIAQGF
jgi:ferredoxin